ncbi:uncharacterized protein B0T23DRAFT_366927 [Neurospora hispaniola]|uniref:Uncharacterized protein n=1 Tax=Neurospora hispaniola TaxID=588809 RepID=A0AAJ0MMU7_9PEZI|nr:hypothetical protein B0T23DRAFT_366927 [Neurospora hispaniola]
MNRASSRGRSMSPPELFERRYSTHQRLIEREEDHGEDSGSGDESGNGSDSDVGDDGRVSDEDPSPAEGEDDNEERTVTEERTITKKHTATQTVTTSPTASDAQKLYHSLTPDFKSHLEPATWSRFIRPHTAVLDISGIAASTSGPIPTEASTSSSSTPPVTTTTNPKRKSFPSTTLISPVYPTTWDSQDFAGEATTGIDATVVRGGPSPSHGDDSSGHKNRPSSPKTTPTTVDGITTPETFSTRSELPVTSPTLGTHPADSVKASEGKQKSSSGDVLKKGAIIGAIAGLVVFGVLLFFLWRKRKHNKKRHNNFTSSNILTSTSKSAEELPEKDPYPFDDKVGRGSIGSESIGRTSQRTFEGVATAIRTSMRQSVSDVSVGATDPGPVSPVSPSGDAASLGGLSSLSRRSSFSYASDDYFCGESATSTASSICQATALTYTIPGRVTPVIPAYPATARIVNLSQKPQKPELVMVRNTRNSSTAELLGLSRNPRNSTIGKPGKGQWDKEACGCGGNRASKSPEVSPPPMAARTLYEALGGSGPGPTSPPSSSRPVTWMRQPPPLSTARNSASSAFVPSPVVGIQMPGSNRRSSSS